MRAEKRRSRGTGGTTGYVFVENSPSLASPLPWHGAVCHLLSVKTFHAVHCNIFAPVWVFAGPFTICPLVSCIWPNPRHAANLLEPSRGLRAGTCPVPPSPGPTSSSSYTQVICQLSAPPWSCGSSAVGVRLRSLFERQGIAVVNVVMVEPGLRAKLLRKVGVGVAPHGPPRISVMIGSCYVVLSMRFPMLQ